MTFNFYYHIEFKINNIFQQYQYIIQTILATSDTHFKKLNHLSKLKNIEIPRDF